MNFRGSSPKSVRSRWAPRRMSGSRRTRYFCPSRASGVGFLMFSLAEKGKRTQDAVLQHARHVMVGRYRCLARDRQPVPADPARLRGLTSFGHSSSGGGSVRSVSAMNSSSAEIGFRSFRTRARDLGHRARGGVEGPALAAMLQQQAGDTSACRSRVATSGGHPLHWLRRMGR